MAAEFADLKPKRCGIVIAARCPRMLERTAVRRLREIMVLMRFARSHAVAGGTMSMATTRMFPTARNERTHTIATMAANRYRMSATGIPWAAARIGSKVERIHHFERIRIARVLNKQMAASSRITLGMGPKGVSTV